MKKIKSLVIFASLSLSLFASVALINGAKADGPLDINNQQGMGEGQEIGAAFGQTSKPEDPRTIAANIIKVALTFVGIIFFGLLIFAGYKYMTAAGNESQIDAAKQQITTAVIGLAVILLAYSITLFVTKSLIGAASKSLY